MATNVWAVVAGVTGYLPLTALTGASGQLLGMNVGATAAEWKAATFLSNQLAVPVGAVGTPAYVFTGSLTTGWYAPAADQVALAIAGTQRLSFTATLATLTGIPFRLVGQLLQEAQSADIVAANGTTDLGGATGNYVYITNAAGAIVVTSLGGATLPKGTEIETKIVIAGGSVQFTNDAIALQILGGANLVCQTGDVIRWRKTNSASAFWEQVSFQRGISSSGFTNKGDWLLGVGGGSTLILAVGADGSVPVADSTQPTGVRWGTVSAPVSVRQSIQTAVLDANGFNALLSAGAGLNFNATVAVVPAVFAFAGGFSSTGNVDLVTRLTANAVNQGTLAAFNTNYIKADYLTGSTVTWGSTVAPWYDGQIYDRGRQAVLQFAGAAGATTFLDDYGNTWTVQGAAKVQTNYFKFGTGGLGGGGATNALDGAADYIRTANITSMGPNGWLMRCWTKPLNALPGAGVLFVLMGAVNAANVGARIGIYNNAGTIKFTYFLSGDGATDTIANVVQGTTTPVLGTEYFVELTFDALAGVYRLYVNGVQEQTTVSAVRVCAVTGMGIGAQNTGASFYKGYIDKPEYQQYCDHPNGTAYAVPVATPNVSAANYSSDFVSIPDMKCYSVTAASTVAGTNPTLTAVNRLYVGEQDTNGGAVTATRNCPIKGWYESPDQTNAVGASISVNHNSSIIPRIVSAVLKCVTSEQGYSVGDQINLGQVDNATNAGAIVVTTRSIQWALNNTLGWPNKGGTARVGLTTANWKLAIRAQRGY